MGGDSFSMNPRAWDWESGGMDNANDDIAQAKQEAETAAAAEEEKKKTSLLTDKDKSSRTRSRLLATSGGISGEELEAGSTTKRDSIFGN